MKNNFGNTNWQEDTNNSDIKDEPHLNINSKKYSPSNKSSKDIDEGEYVDYTEIK